MDDGTYSQKSTIPILCLFAMPGLNFMRRMPTNTWSNPNAQYQWLKKKGTVVKITKEDYPLGNWKNKIRHGDIMYTDPDGNGKVNHATIITKISGDEIYYSAHSESQLDCPLSNYYDNKRWAIHKNRVQVLIVHILE